MTAESGMSAPRTVGEVRRRLAEIGNPWTPDPSLADDAPLPVYHRGGQHEHELPHSRLPEPVDPGSDLTELITAVPPSNVFLRARWAELGLLPAGQNGTGGDRS